MKVYTIYLDGDRGWTDYLTEGFYYEYSNVLEENGYDSDLSEDEFISIIECLDIGKNYKTQIGMTEFEIKCEEMDEEEFDNLPEFSGW